MTAACTKAKLAEADGPADEGDDFDEDERERLHAALRRSAEQLARGEGIAAQDALRRLHEP